MHRIYLIKPVLFRNEIEKFIIMESNDSTVVERAVRTSLTLRKIRCLPCKCGEYSITLASCRGCY